jgi:hypothetical protein
MMRDIKERNHSSLVLNIKPRDFSAFIIGFGGSGDNSISMLH